MATTNLDEHRWQDRETLLKIIGDLREMSPNEACTLQIFGALLKECNLGFQQGFITQSVCNEARVSVTRLPGSSTRRRSGTLTTCALASRGGAGSRAS